MNNKVIIIGGDAAGMSAASQIKRQHADWDVMVFEKGDYVSYAACGMPYYIQGLVSHFDSLIEITPEKFINERKIDLRLKHEVIKINAEEKNVLVKTPEKTFEENFDYLVIATGASPQVPPIPISGNKIFTINNLYDTKKLESFIMENKPESCAVIGGGFIAIEMVESFKNRGIGTHLIHRRDSLARMFEKEVSDAILEEMKQNNVNLHLNCHVESIDEENGKVCVQTSEEKIYVDFLLLATGVKPNSEIAKNAGINTGVRDAISVNSFMQTNYPYIYSAGDCTETRSIITGEPIYTPLALKANREGMIAGLNISGKKEKFAGSCETAITKIFSKSIARTGLTLERALKNNIDAIKFSVISKTKARYYPGAEKMKSIVIAEKGSGRILGAQLVGPIYAVKRIDVWVAAITAKFTLKDIYNLDLAYSPPFSPVWDPVLLAARVGRKHI